MPYELYILSDYLLRVMLRSNQVVRVNLKKF